MLTFSASQLESEPNDTLASANEIGPAQVTTGSIGPGDVDIYRIDTASDSLLVATVHVSSLRVNRTIFVRRSGVDW